jgi:hypothetical protein
MVYTLAMTPLKTAKHLGSSLQTAAFQYVSIMVMNPHDFATSQASRSL